MAQPSFNNAVIARVAAALYDIQLGNETMDWALDQVNAAPGGINDVVQSLYNTDFAGMTDAAVAARMVANVGITDRFHPERLRRPVERRQPGCRGCRHGVQLADRSGCRLRRDR